MSEIVERFLNQLHHPTLAAIDLSLDRMLRFLALLGNPQKRLPPVIHVAGTNGKGSLLAYLMGVYEAAGLRVHRYTSPHLIHFNERIMLAGKPVDNAYLESALKYVAPLLSQQPVTFFEATTALAFLIFAEKPADLLLLETGMGGRLDATNVVEKPLLTAITPISFDHTEYLGTTVSAIAAEKAGIIKKNVPCVVGRQMPEALKVIEEKAAQMSAPLSCLGQEWAVEKNIYRSPKHEITLTPSLAGDYQFDNAATAVACIDRLPQFSVSDAQIHKGLASAVWPARLQRITQGKFARALPSGVELWLDGGHNPQGGEVLAKWLSQQAGMDIYLICGMGKGKDTRAYLAPIAPYVKGLYGIAIPSEANSQSAADIESAAKAAGINALAAPSLENALQTIIAHAKTPALICICGSLYLAGKVLAANN